jgi:hypothetical protein
MSNVPAPTPWYREPWPWVLIGLPGVAVVASLVSAYLAISGADPLIEQDYYRQGLAINAELSRVQRAAELGLHADVEYGGVQQGDFIRVRMTSSQPLTDTAMRIRLVHPARDGADRSAVLGRVPDSSGAAPGVTAEYAGQWLEAPAAGPQDARVEWRIVLEGRDWQLEGDASGRSDIAVR